MAHVPAICSKCGLIFPSPFQAIPGGTVEDCQTDCPRCRGAAPALNGYTVIINNTVTFFLSPEYTLREKKFLIETARAAAKGEVKTSEAKRQLDNSNPESGRLFREWATLGSVFLGAMATVGMFLLAYSESRGNEPPDQPAMEVVEKFICSEPQADKRTGLPLSSQRPIERPLKFQTHTEQGKANGASPKAPNENRHARRARLKKNRSKFSK